MAGPEEAATGRPPAVQLGLLWGAAAVLAAALAGLGPERLARAWRFIPRCPLHALTGIPCPACGSGRATLALARFDVLSALAWNPLFTVSALVFVVGGVVALVAALAGRGVSEPRTVPFAARAALVLAILANWAWLVLDGR
jgi:hypothetical protein